MARSYLKQIAEGLSYCHSHGVLHRWEGDCPAVTLIYHASSSSSLVKGGLTYWHSDSVLPSRSYRGLGQLTTNSLTAFSASGTWSLRICWSTTTGTSSWPTLASPGPSKCQSGVCGKYQSCISVRNAIPADSCYSLSLKYAVFHEGDIHMYPP